MSSLCVECEVEPRLPQRRIGQACYQERERIRARERYRNESGSRRQKRREATTKWKRRTQFKFTDEEYEALVAKQQGLCAICGSTCSSGRNLAVDHCHKTGKVRGLLCGNCNRAIGQLGDDPERIERAASYLRGEL